MNDGTHEFFTKVSLREGLCDGSWHRINGDDALHNYFWSDVHIKPRVIHTVLAVSTPSHICIFKVNTSLYNAVLFLHSSIITV